MLNKLFIVYLKFRFNWMACILSGSPNYYRYNNNFEKTHNNDTFLFSPISAKPTPAELLVLAGNAFTVRNL